MSTGVCRMNCKMDDSVRTKPDWVLPSLLALAPEPIIRKDHGWFHCEVIGTKLRKGSIVFYLEVLLSIDLGFNYYSEDWVELSGVRGQESGLQDAFEKLTRGAELLVRMDAVNRLPAKKVKVKGRNAVISERERILVTLMANGQNVNNAINALFIG